MIKIFREDICIQYQTKPRTREFDLILLLQTRVEDKIPLKADPMNRQAIIQDEMIIKSARKKIAKQIMKKTNILGLKGGNKMRTAYFGRKGNKIATREAKYEIMYEIKGRRRRRQERQKMTKIVIGFEGMLHKF